MIKAYQNNATLKKQSDLSTSTHQGHTNPKNQQQKENKNEKDLYRSDQDEKLIKDYHYAKFQKNLDQIQNNQSLQSLIEKDEWSEDDIKTLLANFR